MNNTVEIKLKGQKYNGRLDMRCLANVQLELKKQGIEMNMQDIFNSIGKQDLAIQSILRCHKQVKRASIEDKMDFSEMENVFSFITKLAETSMPKNEGKQVEE